MQVVHCCRNAAGGLELRAGGSAVLDGCHCYCNGRQGIMSWQSAGDLTAKRCFIHSNAQESGVLVSEAHAIFESCWIYGNGGAGIVAQQHGSIQVLKCEVHDNGEGILIQDTGSATVKCCDVFSNRANGIFVGYDHRGSATIIENKVHDNRYKGILIGNAGSREMLEEWLFAEMPTTTIGACHRAYHKLCHLMLGWYPPSFSNECRKTRRQLQRQPVSENQVVAFSTTLSSRKDKKSINYK